MSIELICITCPAGCALQVEQEGGALRVRGNACKRGLAFAQAELTHPTRSLTSTVRTSFAQAPALPVRSDRELPKGRIPAVMRFLARITVEERLGCGDVVAALPGGEGNIIATSDLLKEI
ncbi:MAG: DUF1667 domain-containing protein [Oscillospiraceae bacterium]|jgi:CxxC motif-containing protein|nr:DUF1667 domain-containing protein [Oscillospiraceae bacterium]